MTPLFKKLNFKDHPLVVVLNLPNELQEEFRLMEPHTRLVYDPEAPVPTRFAMAFVNTLEGVESASRTLLNDLQEDAVLWMCYPKGSSKKYTCEFNRDTGWQAIGAYGMEPVRQVSINDDWSALRFRKTNFIKTLSRDSKMAISEEGRKRTSTRKDPKG